MTLVFWYFDFMKTQKVKYRKWKSKCSCVRVGVGVKEDVPLIVSRPS